MTNQEAWAKIQALGFTIHKKTDSYVVLQGPDGITGITNIDHLTADERIEEISLFIARNMLN